jgi:hypothetical protein
MPCSIYWLAGISSFLPSSYRTQTLSWWTQPFLILQMPLAAMRRYSAGGPLGSSTCPWLGDRGRHSNATSSFATP